MIRPVTPGAVLASLALSGCALEPNSLRLEAEHVSHVSQHFGPDPTGYGFNALMVEAHWQQGRAFLDVADGINISPRLDTVVGPVYGALAGPREIFQARIGYEIPLKP